jgi:hypothetical protein
VIELFSRWSGLNFKVLEMYDKELRNNSDAEVDWPQIVKQKNEMIYNLSHQVKFLDHKLNQKNNSIKKKKHISLLHEDWMKQYN